MVEFWVLAALAVVADVRPFPPPGADASIVRSIIELARSLGLRVVAEGVENEATSQLLAEAGCDIAQGWYYGKAAPAADLPIGADRDIP